MNVHIPESLAQACELLAENSEAELLAGGTDFMVEVNYRHRSPSAVVALSKVPETKGWRVEPNASGDETIWLGATLTFAEMGSPDLARLLPALSQAARTVGSPQIRNAGTLGGIWEPLRPPATACQCWQLWTPRWFCVVLRRAAR